MLRGGEPAEMAVGPVAGHGHVRAVACRGSMMRDSTAALLGGIDPEAIAALVDGRHGDPFSILGCHAVGDERVVRACLPGAEGVEVLAREDGARIGTLEPVDPAGLFAGTISKSGPYRLRISWPDAVQEIEDPYNFGTLLGDLDLHLIAQGTHYELGR